MADSKLPHSRRSVNSEAPLAARMRPRTIDEFVGQGAIVGHGRLLRRAIQADQLSSLIFYGPPGTGKTTLAQIIANTTQAHFIAINAVLAGIKDIRDAIAIAQDRHKQFKQRTILFVDEVHRFNKAQQDALLPWVENGTVILIGATTENPYFEVNKALVSRSRLFQLKPLTSADLQQVVQQALSDPTRGYGDWNIQLDSDALDHLVNVANGDARSLLNALELAVETTPADQNGIIHITLTIAEESIQQRAVLYDKEGDAHFDIISALIKSLRGSDADAALYWLARMIYAGEDPRFIFRRLLILASEDVGLADPNAVVVVNACAQVFDRVGMPEGRYSLAQATLYLATAPKSNSVVGFFDALSTVEREREAEVPLHLRDPNRDQEGFGHGSNYLYPHAYREHWVAQQYLPSSLQGQVFYQPSDQGFEATIRDKVDRDREAQLAALIEELPERLTLSPTNSSLDRWLARSLSQAGERFGAIRDRIFELAQSQRHHLIFDLNAGSGLLTWEAIRQVPEGGVYSYTRTAAEFAALNQQVQSLPELSRPVLVQALPQLIKFDRLIGRNVLYAEPDKASMITSLAALIDAEGRIVLAESMPIAAQRLYQLANPSWLKPKLYDRWQQAEEAIYQFLDDPKLNWTVQDLQLYFEQAGFEVEMQIEPSQTEMYLSRSLFDRWFTTNSDQPTYAERLAQCLTAAEVRQIQQLFLAHLLDQTVTWKSRTLWIQAKLA
ncbi:AAA family ATPase [Leptolyngbya sp. FACHB-17]|uniref:AAA family ATPase n=1 Tax=unclassified Leptolyngbya TaxID=2650499 RepID=UPI001680D834|nr:AAA family ATPase [Leptolyngbya sp. FACHB-17]MBD2081488.1 AAA family ATPase [Leptolyngbya sp. FACHB-17]